MIFFFLASLYYTILKTMSTFYFHDRITVFLKMEDSTEKLVPFRGPLSKYSRLEKAIVT